MEENDLELLEINGSDEEKLIFEENAKLKTEPNNEDYGKGKKNLIKVLKRITK